MSAMNLKEGTRRLALLLGAVGAIVGGFASYAELQSILRQRESHNKYEQLTASDVVKHERKCRLTGMMSGCSNDPYAAIAKPISSPQADSTTGSSSGRDLPPGYTEEPINAKSSSTGGAVLDWSKSIPIPSVVMNDGIKAINWSHDYEVQSIETEDGQTLYPTPAPAAWLYLLTALFPILGFFVPWGAIRAIGWVGAGFFGGIE